MDELLTLKEIAAQLGVPESNLRYYRNRIGDFLPSIGKGRRRRYYQEAADIFKKTIDHINDGITLDRIYAIFAENKPLALRSDIARPAQEELADLIVKKIRESFGSLSNPLDLEAGGQLLTSQSGLEEEVYALRQEIETFKSENQDLTDKLAERERIIQDLSTGGTGDFENPESNGRENAGADIAALEERISNLEAELERLAGMEATIDELKEQNDALANDYKAVSEKLAERERIIEGQKDALDKARSKRLALQEELDRFRSSMQS